MLDISLTHFANIVIGLVLAVVAGVSVFIVVLIANGVGPGWPRLPRQTAATVLRIDGEAVGVQAPRCRYFATVRWTNEHGQAVEQRDAWGIISPNLTAGTTVAAVAFRETRDPKLRLSPERIGLGSVADYWHRQGLWDWGTFWGPILLVVPATFAACVLLRNRKAPAESAV
jgi:hypothetical protein